ncbi:RHS repeat-associated core domain-containing protein [Pseudomonas putida]|uniref:RHS repeat-associated core domain-containing protein n=1 Tax=Pseudomonas putida TaxID=303 RepID=UPI0030CFD060
MQKRASSSLYFYQRDSLFSVQQENEVHTLFKGPEALIAEFTSSNSKTILLETDYASSVLSGHRHDASDNHLYTPYGYDHREKTNGLISGFNGHRRDPLRGGYLLGNGYRSYNQRIYRFEAPDSFSPFHEGGLNTYAYCLNDPVNLHDPSGHGPWKLRKFFGKKETSTLKTKYSASAPSLVFDEPPSEYAQQPATNPHPQGITAIPQFMDHSSKLGGSAPLYAMSASDLGKVSSNTSQINLITSDTRYQNKEVRKYTNALNRHLEPKIRRLYEAKVMQHKTNISNNSTAIRELLLENQKLEKPWLNDAVSKLRDPRVTNG